MLRKALQLGQSLPRAHCYMVLEDDAWADDAVLVREIIAEAQRFMLKDWVVLQLGSRNCGRAPHSLRRTVKNLSDGFKLCVAERNILAHAYVVNKKHGDLLLHQCRMGKTSDNMLQAVQNACLRKKCGTCYTVRPSLVVQSKQQASTTCKFLTWELACASSTSSQHMLPANDRGFQKINKRKLADIRQRGARRGGKIRAGNGTTADQSAAKKRRIIKWARKHGFPSRRVAQQKFGLSSAPWKALKMMAWKT